MSTIFRDQVTVGSFTFNNNAVINGARFYMDLLDSWNDTPDLTVQTASFGFSDGVAYAARFPRTAKFMEVGGYVLTTTRADAERAMQRLSEVFPNGDLSITRYSGLPRRIIAVRSSKIAFPDDVAEQGFRWQVQIMQPWPYKLSPTEQTIVAGTYSGVDYYRSYTDEGSNVYTRVYTTDTVVNYRVYSVDSTASSNSYGYPDTITVLNSGNANAYPVFQVSGPLTASSWSLVNEATNESMSFGMDISTGSTLIIDTLKRTAYLDGQPVDYFITGDWPVVPPGSSTIRLYVGADNPSASIRIIVSDTWEG